jgi:hypothetical protein
MIALTLGDQGSLVLTDRPHRPTRLYSLTSWPTGCGRRRRVRRRILHGWLTTRDVQRAQDLGNGGSRR